MFQLGRFRWLGLFVFFLWFPIDCPEQIFHQFYLGLEWLVGHPDKAIIIAAIQINWNLLFA